LECGICHAERHDYMEDDPIVIISSRWMDRCIEVDAYVNPGPYLYTRPNGWKDEMGEAWTLAMDLGNPVR
jgi:hypothetical protein